MGGSKFESRIKGIWYREGVGFENNEYVRYSGTSTTVVRISDNGTTNGRTGSISKSGRNSRVEDIAPI